MGGSWFRSGATAALWSLFEVSDTRPDLPLNLNARRERVAILFAAIDLAVGLPGRTPTSSSVTLILLRSLGGARRRCAITFSRGRVAWEECANWLCPIE